MTRPRDQVQDKNTSRRDRRQRRFVGVDGEGGDIYGSHEYLLLRAGEHVLETGEPLTAEECLGFLADLPHDCIYVSFFFDYDVTMILRGLSDSRIGKVLDRPGRTFAEFRSGPMPVDVGQFQVDYLPHKEFRVRRRLGKKQFSPWTVVSDTGTFFQCSFVAALRKWYGSFQDGLWQPNPGESHMAGVIDQIEEGKQQRNSFGRVTEYEREYNLLEIKALEALMTKFRAMCDRVGLVPGKWQGPGNLVMAQFRKVGLPRNSELTMDTEFLTFANSAYYGGRFEACAFGEIDGPIYQYDINSAYARTYSQLPCLRHGDWEFTADMPTSGIYVGDVSFTHSRVLACYTLPIRTRTGSIVFPRSGRGTYWSPELRTLVEHGGKVEWHGGYRYLSHGCDCQNFEWVEDLYAERKRLGKDGTGYVLKIMLATIYGKLAQSVGAAPYANPVWAGLIVSTVRAQLCRAALTDVSGTGDDVVMLATDGLFCRTPRDSITIGPQLGEWDLTEHDSMFVVQSGVYMLPEKSPKTRGVSQRKVIQHTWDFVQCWERFVRDPSAGCGYVTVQLRSFLGLRQAFARGRMDLAGQWLYGDRNISFDWSTKRRDPVLVDNAVWTSAPVGGPDLLSEPYKRLIGGTSIFRDIEEDQPDWADTL